MGERGINLAHTTILRWVHQYTPEFERRWKRFARLVGGSWRMDETYIKVGSGWVYVCRAVDKAGQTVEFLLGNRAQRTRYGLCALQKPLLYLSLYLKTNRQAYYDYLTAVGMKGNWEGWLEFFLEGVRETSTQAVGAARQSVALMDADRKKVEGQRRATATALRVHQHAQTHPILSIASTADEDRDQFSNSGGGDRAVGAAQDFGGSYRSPTEPSHCL